MPPTAEPATAIAKKVSGVMRRALRMNVRPARAVYGCGNRSRRLSQILRLFACTTSDWRSPVCQERISHERNVRCMRTSATPDPGRSWWRSRSNPQTKERPQARADDVAGKGRGEPDPAVDARGSDAAEVRADIAAVGD